MALGLLWSCSEPGSSVTLSFFFPLDSTDGSLLDSKRQGVVLRLEVAQLETKRTGLNQQRFKTVQQSLNVV